MEARAAPATVEVEVHLPTLLRDCVEGEPPLRVRGATLAEALRNLFAAHPRLRVHLYDETGQPRRHVLLYYNDENLAWLETLDVPLREGDQISVLQAVSGG